MKIELSLNEHAALAVAVTCIAAYAIVAIIREPANGTSTPPQISITNTNNQQQPK